MLSKCHIVKNEISPFINVTEDLHNYNEFKEIKNVIGYSANAITVLLFGLGYAVQEINKIIIKVMSNQFLNNITYNSSSEASKTLSVVINSKTSTKTTKSNAQVKLSAKDDFLIWLQEQTQNKLGNPLATFADLHKQSKRRIKFKNINLAGLDIETGKLQIFNYKNTPRIPLAIAARICMSYYTSFSAVEIIDLIKKQKNTYVDGGLVLQYFDMQ